MSSVSSQKSNKTFTEFKFLEINTHYRPIWSEKDPGGDIQKTDKPESQLTEKDVKVSDFMPKKEKKLKVLRTKKVFITRKQILIYLII